MGILAQFPITEKPSAYTGKGFAHKRVPQKNRGNALSILLNVQPVTRGLKRSFPYSIQAGLPT